MININDIKERLEVNKEPIEVSQMRENILNSFNNLEFIEEGHKYYLHNEDGTVDEPISVSGLIKDFEVEIDWDLKAQQKALREGVDVSVIKRMWEENNVRATNTGSLHHLYGENLMKLMIDPNAQLDPVIKPQFEKGYLIPSSPKQEAIEKYWTDLLGVKEMYPLIPEVKMYMPKDNKFGIKKLYCGTADITFAYKYKGEWGILLHDYKGLPLDTPIATEKGWSLMRDLKNGDKVFDKNGKLTTILHTSEIHNKPCLKITFDDKTSIVCDEDHRWEVSFSKSCKNKDGKRVYENKVMTAKELYDYMETLPPYGKGRQSPTIPKILVSKPLDMAEQELPIHPYVLGVWLGDGNSYDGYITNMYEDLWEEIERCGYTLGDDVSKNSSGRAQTRCVKGLMKHLRLLNLKGDKHIPDIYLRASYEQRLEILRGLMDTDGYYNKTRNSYVLTTTREKQADFCYELLSTLGIKAIKLKAKGRCTNCKNKKIFDKWDVRFTTDIYPFKIRKIATKTPTNERYRFRNIINIEKTETVPTRCIEVDSPTHTYCCGYNMLVTHNTNASLTNNFVRDIGQMMLPPFDYMYDEALSHYTFQLSAYSLMLMNLGYKVFDRKLIWLKSDGNYEKVQLPDITKQIINIYK